MTLKVGDLVRINIGCASPCYTITNIYKNEKGILCADGEGGVGAKMKGVSLDKLKKVN